MTKSILFYSFDLCFFSSESKITVRRYISFIGNQPSNQRWSLDGQKSILIESKNDIGSSTYFVDKTTIKPQLVSPKEAFSKLNFW
jgi:hypothetical protein